MDDSSNDPHPEPIMVASYPDRGEAEVTRAHLADNGIAAVIVDEVEGGTIPVDGEMSVRVLVPAEDAETARRVLEG